MTAARALATIVVVFACAAQSPAPLSGEVLLGRAKATFRAHARPTYVVYTLTRRDRHNGQPDLENSYVAKVWCRNADRSALVRRVWRGEAYGDMENQTVAFDGVVDPGPPTADVFERALYAAASPGPAPAPEPDASVPPMIGSVVVVRDFDYRVRRAVREGDRWHLGLEPKRDPERNRIDDLWIDAATYEIRRMRVRDHLFLGYSGAVLDDEFDVRFEERDGLPLIAAIHGRTGNWEFETDYRYEQISFPETLPDWYFEPKSYGRHKADAPR